jgi:hypothetical protein
MILLKLKVIVLAAVSAPPLPVIIRVNDIINDFTVGNIKTNANADIIDLRDLLIGYNATSNLSDFVTATAEGTGTV